MTLAEQTFMGADSHVPHGSVRCLGHALAQMLAVRFPLQTQKSVAQALRCTPKAAENILRGHLSRRSAGQIIEAFGPGFMADAVMLAAGTTLESYIRSQADEARASAHRHQEKARQLAQLETQLAASRRPQSEGRVGRAP